jgi:hypothetical protein
MISNADMTIFNKYYDRNLGHDVYLRSYLYSINWQGSRAVTVNDKGLLTADFTEVFTYPDSAINKTYLKPKAWANSGEKELYFTFNAGDIIVKGITDFNLTGIKPYNLEGLKNAWDDVLTIVSVMDLTDTGLPHWEIGAK